MFFVCQLRRVPKHLAFDVDFDCGNRKANTRSFSASSAWADSLAQDDKVGRALQSNLPSNHDQHSVRCHAACFILRGAGADGIAATGQFQYSAHEVCR